MLVGICIAGFILIAGAEAAACYLKSRDPESIKKGIKELESQIENFQESYDRHYSIYQCLNNSLQKLEDARTNFINGGYVNEGVPLAAEEFKHCIDDLEIAIDNLSKVLDEISSDIELKKNKKYELEIHLNMVIKEINEELKKEGKIP